VINQELDTLIMNDLRVFIGFDSRQPLAHTVAYTSLTGNAGRPVSVTPLILEQLPIQRRGLTEFTFSRYLVPWLMDYQGIGVFLDADVLVVGDIWRMLTENSGDPICVVKNAQRFEWPSVMLFNCARCTALTPEYIEKETPQNLEWADSIGELSKEWNHLVGYDSPNPQAKIIHFTMGIPCFAETQDIANGEWREAWARTAEAAMHTLTWQEMMGDSVHRTRVLGNFP
jgi:hypothetical protein